MPLLRASLLGTAVPAGCWLPCALQGARGKKNVLQAGNSLGNWWQDAAHPRLSKVTGLQRGLWSPSACRSGDGVVPQRGSWHCCVFKPAFSTLEVVRTVLPGSFLSYLGMWGFIWSFLSLGGRKKSLLSIWAA